MQSVFSLTPGEGNKKNITIKPERKLKNPTEIKIRFKVELKVEQANVF